MDFQNLNSVLNLKDLTQFVKNLFLKFCLNVFHFKLEFFYYFDFQVCKTHPKRIIF